MTDDLWDPELYERFVAERSRPFHDLVAGLEPCPGGALVDLGCGTGALTAGLHRRLGSARALGVDASPAMLERAAAHAGDGLEFAAGDLAAVDLGSGGGPFDVVVSNAALHWVDDHPALLPRLVALLAPGGQLAVQVPANHRHPSQTVAAAVAREAPFAAALGGFTRVSPVLEPEAYALTLRDLGLVDIAVEARVYLHELPGVQAVVDWVTGTTLTDYQRRMPAALFDRFLERYAQALARELGPGPDGRVAFTFRRVLFRARAPG